MDRLGGKIRTRNTTEETLEEEDVEREFIERERESMERASGSVVREVSPRSSTMGQAGNISHVDMETKAERREREIRQEQMWLQKRLLLGRKSPDALSMLREEHKQERECMEKRESIEMQRHMVSQEMEVERESWQRQDWRREREDMEEQRRGERVEREERQRAAEVREELLEEGNREVDCLTEQLRLERGRLDEKQESREQEMWREREEWRRPREFIQVALERVEITRRMEKDKLEGEMRELRVLVEVTSSRLISGGQSRDEKEEQVMLTVRERESVEKESSESEMERDESHITVEAKNSEDHIKAVEELERVQQKNKMIRGFFSRRLWKKPAPTEGASTEEESGEESPPTENKVSTVVNAMLIQDRSREEMEKDTERVVENEEKTATGERGYSGTETTQKELNTSKKRFWSWWRRRKQAPAHKDSAEVETGQQRAQTASSMRTEVCTMLNEQNKREEMKIEESTVRAEDESSESKTRKEENKKGQKKRRFRLLWSCKKQPTVEKETLTERSGQHRAVTKGETDTAMSSLFMEEKREREEKEMEKEKNSFLFQEKSREGENKAEIKDKKMIKKTRKGFKSLFCCKKRSTVVKESLKEESDQQSVLTEKEKYTFTEEGESSGKVMEAVKEMEEESQTKKTKRIWSLRCCKKRESRIQEQ